MNANNILMCGTFLHALKKSKRPPRTDAHKGCEIPDAQRNTDQTYMFNTTCYVFK